MVKKVGKVNDDVELYAVLIGIQMAVAQNIAYKNTKSFALQLENAIKLLLKMRLDGNCRQFTTSIDEGVALFKELKSKKKVISLKGSIMTENLKKLAAALVNNSLSESAADMELSICGLRIFGDFFLGKIEFGETVRYISTKPISELKRDPYKPNYYRFKDPENKIYLLPIGTFENPQTVWVRKEVVCKLGTIKLKISRQLPVCFEDGRIGELPSWQFDIAYSEHKLEDLTIRDEKGGLPVSGQLFRFPKKYSTVLDLPSILGGFNGEVFPMIGAWDSGQTFRICCLKKDDADIFKDRLTRLDDMTNLSDERLKGEIMARIPDGGAPHSGSLLTGIPYLVISFKLRPREK